MRWAAASAIVVIAMVSAVEVDARGGGGRGGGGGFGGGAVRGGAASNGGFSSGSSAAPAQARAAPAQKPSAPTAQPRDNVSQLPSVGRGDWDSGARPPGLAAGIVVGVAIARRSYLAYDGYYYYYEPMSTLPCTPVEISVGDVVYYQCGSAYYVLTYEGGSLMYVQVDPPAGYQ